MLSIELGGGLTGVAVNSLLRSNALQEEAENKMRAGQFDDARELNRQSDKLANRAFIAGVPGVPLFGTSIGIIIKELR